MALALAIEADSRGLPVGLAWLTRRHRVAIAAHFARLLPGDRTRRFGRPLSDTEIVAHTAGLDFARDGFLGALTSAGAVNALAQVRPSTAAVGDAFELAISVDPSCRGRGFAARLVGSIVDRLHGTAATSVVAIDIAPARAPDALRAELGLVPGAGGNEVCMGIRIEAEPLPPHAHRLPD
jgi:GNAT superfamily N-acetyltransferase